MATIQIGGRELQVKRPTVGFWDRCLKFEVDAKTMTVGEFVNGSAALIAEAVDGNEGATVAWLRDQLSFPPADEWTQLMIACGFVSGKTEPSTGEAPTP